MCYKGSRGFGISISPSLGCWALVGFRLRVDRSRLGIGRRESFLKPMTLS